MKFLNRHEADLISQFVRNRSAWTAVNGAGWRKSDGALKTQKKEGHIVYYVFFRLFEEAKTRKGEGVGP